MSIATVDDIRRILTDGLRALKGDGVVGKTEVVSGDNRLYLATGTSDADPDGRYFEVTIRDITLI